MEYVYTFHAPSVSEKKWIEAEQPGVGVWERPTAVVEIKRTNNPEVMQAIVHPRR